MYGPTIGANETVVRDVMRIISLHLQSKFKGDASVSIPVPEHLDLSNSDRLAIEAEAKRVGWESVSFVPHGKKLEIVLIAPSPATT